jgi:hypothetical protein
MSDDGVNPSIHHADERSGLVTTRSCVKCLRLGAEVARLTKLNAEDRAARKNELDRAIEVRENANRVSVRVQMENDALLAEARRLRDAVEEFLLWQPGKAGHAAATARLRGALGSQA